MIGLLMEDDLFTIIRTLPSGKDPLGRPVNEVISREPSAGRLEQTGSAEGEAFVVNKFRAFFPISAEVSAGDLIECRGRVYTVEGEPSAERIPGFPAIANLTAVLNYVGPVDG